jgi:hypothetical protein
VFEERLRKEIDMSKSQLIKSSGWAFIASAFAFITILNGSDALTIPGSEISAILLAVGLLGLRARYGEQVGSFGRDILLLGASGPILLLVVIAMGFSGILTTPQITEGLWVLLFGGPAISLLGLTLFGLVAFRSKPMPRLNWLPFFAGIWYPVTYTLFSLHDISHNGVFPEQYLPALVLLAVLQFLALCLLGFILVIDSPKELATA